MRSRPLPSAPRSAAVLAVLTVLLAACSGPAAVAPTTSPPTSSIPAGSPSAAVSPSATPGASAGATRASPSFPMTLVDDDGTALTLPTAPRRIVALTPAATETLFALGVGDRVVGRVDDPTTYPPEASRVPTVAKFGSVDVERIVGLGADLVIAGGHNFNPPGSIAKLRSLGVPTLVVYAPDVASALADIELIGRAVGKPAEAATITGRIRTAFDEVHAAVAPEPRVRVFYELDASNGYFGPAPDYFGTEMLRTAGAEPLTTGKPGVFQIDPEQIVAFDPQVILLGDAAYGVTSDAVGKRPGWASITAVKKGAIRPIDDVIVTRPGPRLGAGLRELVRAIHPDLVLSAVLADSTVR